MAYTQTGNPDLVNPQEIIKKAFPNSKITWSKEIQGEMVNFKATSTALAIMIGNGNERKIKFINFKDTTEWSIDCPNKSCREYKMVGGDELKLLIRGFKDGMPQTKVIDGIGEEIFDLTLKTWLAPSPSGIYYYTRNNPGSYNLLEVYDSEGRFVWKRTEYPGGDWLAQALSDSELIYEDRTGCYLLDALSGEEISKISRNLYRHTLPGFKLKDAVPASNGKYFVLFHGDGLVSLNAEKGILWLKETPGTVFYVAISDDGRFVSVYSKERRNGKESKLALMDNLDQGKIIWSSAVKTEGYEGTSNIGGLEIVGDIVRLIPRIVDYRVQTGITPDMRTLCYQIDGETGKLLREFVLPGVVEFIRDRGKTMHLFLLGVTDEKQIHRICEVVVK
jgi:hypothetical protein